MCLTLALPDDMRAYVAAGNVMALLGMKGMHCLFIAALLLLPLLLLLLLLLLQFIMLLFQLRPQELLIKAASYQRQT